MKRELPEIEFITVKEDAYQRAEELASFGFAVSIFNDGNVFRLQSEEMTECNTSQPAYSLA